MPRRQNPARNRPRGHGFAGRELDRLEKLHENPLLLRHELAVAGHLEKPRRAIAMLDHGENAGRFASRSFTVLLVECRRLTGHLDGLRKLLEFLLRHRRLADLTAPTIHIAEIATRAARQRDHTYVRLLAVL